MTNARASVGRVQLDPNKAPTDAAQLEQFQAAQGQLSNALSRLLVVVERYPELKANQNFLRFAGATGRNGEPDLGRARKFQHRGAELQHGGAQFPDKHDCRDVWFPAATILHRASGRGETAACEFQFRPAPTPAANLNQGPAPTPATARRHKVILNLAVARAVRAKPKGGVIRDLAVDTAATTNLRAKQVALLVARYLLRLRSSRTAAEVIPPKPDRYFNDYAGVVSKAAA